MNVGLIRIAGWITLFCAVFHVGFWWIFDWSTGLDPLNDVDWGIMLALDIAVAYLLFACAAASLLTPPQLVDTPIGRVACLVFAGFWLVRGVDQFFLFAEPGLVVPVLCLVETVLYGAPPLLAGRASRRSLV